MCFRKLPLAKKFKDKRGGGVSRFSIEIFLSHSAEKIRRGIFQCFTNFWSRKNLDKRAGVVYQDFPSKIFSLRAENFRRGIFNVAIISGIEKVWIREGGVTDLPSEFLSHCTEIIHWRTFWCFRKILLSKIFMHRRGASRFSRNFFSHRTETKSFVKEPFCFRENFWYRKKFMDKRGHITIFNRNFYVSVPKTFVRKSYCFWENFWFQKNMDEKGGITFFRRKFLVSQCQKISWASLQGFRKSGVSQNFMHTGSITFFRGKFFVSQCRKISWASLQCFRKFGVSKNFMHNRGYHKFPSKIFGLTVPKNFVGIPSMFQKIWGIEKFYA